MSSLTPDGIRNAISDALCSRLDALVVFPQLQSTNSYLLRQSCPPAGRFRVVIAEHQTEGRGRMNRRWVSPPASGLCMSIAYTFERLPQEFASLSLAVGVAIAQALEELGVRGIGLKWPNDLVLRDGKLGGVLAEVHPVKSGGATVVVGVGINTDLQRNHAMTDMTSSLGRVVDLASSCDKLPSRSDIAAALIAGLVDAMARFGANGFSSFHDTWRRYDWLRGREVTVESATATAAGIADGVDTDGALLLNTGGTRQRVTTGSIVLNGRSRLQA